ncbi:MAG: DUF5615 family PIN-like protein [Rubrobacteraceae bacterium]
MRLPLDEHLSGKVIGEGLEERGYDVRSISAEKELTGLEDEGVLDLATSEGRILVTANVSDFLPLINGLVEAGKSHAGCIHLPKSFGSEDFGPIISAIERELAGLSREEWINRVVWARR